MTTTTFWIVPGLGNGAPFRVRGIRTYDDSIEPDEELRGPGYTGEVLITESGQCMLFGFQGVETSNHGWCEVYDDTEMHGYFNTYRGEED